MPVYIDAVDNAGLATGRGAKIVLRVDDDQRTKATVTGEASDRRPHQFPRPKCRKHRIDGHDPATGASIPGLEFVTTTSPAPPNVPPRCGLAAKHSGDQGIARDRAVYVAVDLRPAWPWNRFRNPPPPNCRVDLDPKPGIARAHMRCRKDPGRRPRLGPGFTKLIPIRRPEERSATNGRSQYASADVRTTSLPALLKGTRARREVLMRACAPFPPRAAPSPASCP